MNILFLCLIIFAFAWLAIVSFVALCMVLVVTETKKELEALKKDMNYKLNNLAKEVIKLAGMQLDIIEKRIKKEELEKVSNAKNKTVVQ